MKILLSVPEFPPYSVGGGGEVYKKIAKGFRDSGNEVVVVYGFYGSKSIMDSIEHYTNDGIKFYKIPEIPCPKNLPFLKTVLPPNPKSWVELENIIKKESPEVAYLHGYGFLLVNIVSKICKKLGIKYIYTLHGAPVTQNKLGGLIKIAYLFYNFFYGQKTLNNAFKITAVSRYTTTFPEFIDYKDKIEIINNGIDVEEYVQLKNKFKKKEKVDELIEVVSLGRLEWLKGFQFFIDIIPDLLKEGLKIKYKIAGKDNGFKEVLDARISELGIKENVEFVGQLDFENKVKFILESDYVLVPSLVENYPAVPIEAILLDRPVIGNKAGGIPEIIVNGENGYLTDVTKKDVFFKDVKNILKNKVNLKKTNDLEKYSWSNKVKQYLDLI